MSAGATGKVWLVFAGVFVAGAIAGGLIAPRLTGHLVERGRGPTQFAPRLLEHLDESLELTEAQRADIRVHVEATWANLHNYRTASRDEMRALEVLIISELNDMQKNQFAKMQEKQRKRWQSLGERGRGGDGHVCGPDCEIHPEGRRKGLPSRPRPFIEEGK
jgi:Spy/CpxP family protein refolding chaperone